MVHKPVCLFSPDEEIGEKEKAERERKRDGEEEGEVKGNKVNTGNDGRGEEGRWAEGGRKEAAIGERK